MLDRPQPSNVEAERGILGTILNNNQAMDTAQEIINADDFYDSKHNLIYRAMIYLNNKKSAIDIVTIGDLLKSKLSEIGGITYLS
ncbi:DnaB-like helicase N-terminal domain-containing protein, partial [Arthrospira platensis SPKY1]|nr:DnaB-like helicase N-terminal domain-containing protein [Arthrospira platensis SPKY1]